MENWTNISRLSGAQIAGHASTRCSGCRLTPSISSSHFRRILARPSRGDCDGQGIGLCPGV